jgi:large subunit ribosomal protein L17
MAVIALVSERTATAEAEAARGTKFADKQATEAPAKDVVNDDVTTAVSDSDAVDANVIEAAEADAEARAEETEGESTEDKS